MERLNSNEGPGRGHAARTALIVAGIIVLLGSVGALLIFVGGGFISDDSKGLLTGVLAVVACGAGGFLLEVAGSAVFETVMLPFRFVYRSVVPAPAQVWLQRRAGGPLLLLCILVAALLLSVAVAKF